jgi:hypothetical protein
MPEGEHVPDLRTALLAIDDASYRPGRHVASFEDGADATVEDASAV